MSEMTKGEGAKSGFLAGCLTLLFPGLGQLYNGQILKGITVLLLFTVVFWAFGVLGRGGGEALLIPALYVVALVDAVRIAGKKTAARQVGAWEFF